jgi:hypothetical protein
MTYFCDSGGKLLGEIPEDFCSLKSWCPFYCCCVRQMGSEISSVEGCRVFRENGYCHITRDKFRMTWYLACSPAVDVIPASLIYLGLG